MNKIFKASKWGLCFDYFLYHSARKKGFLNNLCFHGSMVYFLLRSLLLICRNQVLVKTLFHFRPLSYLEWKRCFLAALFSLSQQKLFSQLFIIIFHELFRLYRSVHVLQEKKWENLFFISFRSGEACSNLLLCWMFHLIFGFNYSKLYKSDFLKRRKRKIFFFIFASSFLFFFICTKDSFLYFLDLIPIIIYMAQNESPVIQWTSAAHFGCFHCSWKLYTNLIKSFLSVMDI